ncbi:MAG TPA: hypothetical protein VF173_38840 [Thermoanaerobaculia bacterium]|nr:hypothetical protein [Thermoanaerobaculia bacterium]
MQGALRQEHEDRASKAGAITDLEALALGGGHQPVVQRDELKGRGPPFGCEEGGGKLKGVGSAKRMDSEKAPRGLENDVNRLDAVPMPSEGIQSFEGLGRRLRGESALPLNTGDRRGALDGRTPPGDSSRFAEVEIP